MFRRPPKRPESANSLIGGGLIAVVLGAVMFALLAAEDFEAGSGRALWGFVMAPLGVVMLIAGIVKRARGRR